MNKPEWLPKNPYIHDVPPFEADVQLDEELREEGFDAGAEAGIRATIARIEEIEKSFREESKWPLSLSAALRTLKKEAGIE